MNIGLNVCLWGNHPAGLDRYTIELVKSLTETRNLLKLYLFTPDRKQIAAFPETGLIVKEKASAKSGSPWQRRICWEQHYLPALLEDTPIHALHAPVYVLPLPYTFPRPIKTVVTVHDVIYRIRPEDYSPDALAYLNLYVPLSLKVADHIIAVSECCKRDVIEHFGVDEEKISAIPLAASTQFSPQSKNQIDKFRGDYALPENFILYVGSLVKRKNLLFLLESFALMKRKREYHEKLVLAGGDAMIGSNRQEIFDKITSLGLDGEVMLTDYFPHRYLPLLYSAASLFVYPSLYEGFGLPPLEAMACGTPVITSNISSLPEVVGNAAIKVSPTDSFELSHAMEKVLEDETLRRDLSKAGLKQAAKFSWRKTAKETLKVYQKVLV